MSALFTDPATARAFVTAGNAEISLKSEATGVKFVYRVQSADRGGYYVKLLCQGEAMYVGGLDVERGLRLTAASGFGASDGPVRAFHYFWRHLAAGRIAPRLEVGHLGRCCVCNRRLTIGGSMELGVGPECAKRYALRCA